jgi:hypothetical protein
MGSCDEAGYYSIALDDSVELHAGQPFAVAAEMTTAVYTAPIPIEEAAVLPNPPTGVNGAANSRGFDVEPPTQEGVSFVRHTEADPWTDLAVEGKNACLRARTAPRLAQITKSVTPTGEVEYGDRLIYTLAISASPGTEMALYDPLLGTTFDRFLAQPTGLEHVDGAITGTLSVTSTGTLTASFAVNVDVPDFPWKRGSVVNKACVRPVGGQFAGCLWSVDVANPLSPPGPTEGCLPVYGEPEQVHTLYPPTDLHHVVSADFNGDGWSDALLARALWQSDEVFELDILLNDGDGSLALGTTGVFSGAVPAVMDAREVVLADFNGDGRPDVFIADEGNDSPQGTGHQNTLLLSAPGGKLVDATHNLPQGSDYTHSAAAADIDSDGDVDLYVGNLWGYTPQILLNHGGTGQFTVAAGRLPFPVEDTDFGAYTTSEFVDVNNDAFPDLILGHSGDDLEAGPDSLVLLNDGTGHFAHLADAIPAKPFAVSDVALDIDPADLNGDGYRDLVLVFTNEDYVGRYIQLLINQQDGTFRDETPSLLPQSDNDDPWIKWVQLLDLDMDGYIDIVASPLGDQEPLFYLNDGHGLLRPLPNVFRIGTDNLFDFLDLDGDGFLDVLWSYPGCYGGTCPETHFVVRALGCPLFLPLVRRDAAAEQFRRSQWLSPRSQGREVADG